MEQIIEQLRLLNTKDVWDIIGVVTPMVLTLIIIVQNYVIFRRNEKLQKDIVNREERNRYHNDVMSIYNLYYEFCDCIFGSGFATNVRSGNYYAAVTWNNNLLIMRQKIGRTKELAKLIFKKNNWEIYELIEDRFDFAIKIIDKYMEYISSGQLYRVSENAWTAVSDNNILFKYNYTLLCQDNIKYNNFMKLCESDSIIEIEKMTKSYEEKHSYDNFDKFFEKFISLSELK